VRSRFSYPNVVRGGCESSALEEIIIWLKENLSLKCCGCVGRVNEFGIWLWNFENGRGGEFLGLR
jgi:hypothetical protein